MEIRPPPSRAQLRQRASHAKQSRTAIAHRKRRRRLGQALNLPTDKRSLSAIASQVAAGQLIDKAIAGAAVETARFKRWLFE